jgi:hypothetical protein
MMFGNRVLRGRFGPKRDEVTGGSKNLHEELHDLYSLPSIIRMIKLRRMRWAGHVARMEAKRNKYRILVGKPEGKRPLGRPRRRWVDNIKMDLREIGWCGADWTDLSQDRDQWRVLVNKVMNLRVPQNAGKFLSSCTTGGFPSRVQPLAVSLVLNDRMTVSNELK